MRKINVSQRAVFEVNITTRIPAIPGRNLRPPQVPRGKGNRPPLPLQWDFST